MKSTDQNGEKMVILLLVVGLTAFSSALKELNQVQQFARDASRLIAQWSDEIVPTEVPHTVVKLEACESNKPLQQSLPSVELPWLANGAQEKTIKESRTVALSRSRQTKPSGVQIARLKKVPRIEIDPVQFEVRILTDHDAEPDGSVNSESSFLFKAKTRKHGAVRINPREREMFLKTLNRSLNLRVAS